MLYYIVNWPYVNLMYDKFLKFFKDKNQDKLLRVKF